MSENYKKIADEVRQNYYKWIHQTLEKFLEGLIYHFNQRSANEFGVSRAEFLQAVAQINQRRDVAEARLAKEIDQLFAANPKARPAFSVEELSLVDDFVVERYVQRAKMVGYLMKSHGSEIKKVESRLARLQSLGASINPQALTPLRVFQAMGAALDEFGLEEAQRIECVKLSESELVPTLVVGYQVVNDMLDQYDINVSYEITRTEQAGGPAANSGYYPLEHLLEKLENLNASLDDLDKEKLVNDHDRQFLTELLRHVPPPDPVSEDGTKPQISEANAAQMREVERIVQSIAKDEEVDSRVQKLVRDLYLPMAIMSLRNPMQFSNAIHPGRMLMRELSLFGKKHPQVIDRRLDEVNYLVQHVMLENANDDNVLAEVSQSIWQICEQEIKNYISQTIQAGKDRTVELREKDATRRVVLEIREQLLDKHLPPAAKPIISRLMAPWMVNRYLKYGYNSTPWLESVAYMRVGMEAMQPLQEKSMMKRRFAMRSHLLLTLRKRAARSILPIQEIKQMIAEMEAYFAELNALDSQRVKDGATGSCSLPETSAASFSEADIVLSTEAPPASTEPAEVS